MKNRSIITCALALASAAGMAQAQSFFEGFEGTPPPWTVSNQSNPLGSDTWVVGAGFFAPFAGANYAFCDYTCGASLSTLSCWLVLPVLTLRNGDTLSFYTRAVNGSFPDRMQVRMASTDSTNTGTTETDVGAYTTLLLDINPGYAADGYPLNWTQQTITLSGLPGAGVTGHFAFRYFVELGGPSGDRSFEVGIDDVTYVSSADATGACCFTDGTCQPLVQGICASQGGTFHSGQTCAQASCPQPPTGACCKNDGSCAFITNLACAAALGVFHGADVQCNAVSCPQPWHEVGDAGDLPATAQAVTGTGPVSAIMGHIDAGDADMYKINICDHAAFSASTIADVGIDSQLFLFDSSGKGLTMDDGNADDLAGTILTSQLFPANGNYYLAYTLYNRDPADASANFIWNDSNPDQNYFPEWVPNGPGASNAIAGWIGSPGSSNDYSIVLTGTCFIGSCYANCDLSTTTPILNANDFQCFLNKFAAQDPTANCDQSTADPMLNANDFQCFLNAFAAGCPT